MVVLHVHVHYEVFIRNVSLSHKHTQNYLLKFIQLVRIIRLYHCRRHVDSIVTCAVFFSTVFDVGNFR